MALFVSARSVKSTLGYIPSAAPPDLVNVKPTIDNKNPDYKPPNRGPRPVGGTFSVQDFHNTSAPSCRYCRSQSSRSKSIKRGRPSTTRTGSTRSRRPKKKGRRGTEAAGQGRRRGAKATRRTIRSGCVKAPRGGCDKSETIAVQGRNSIVSQYIQ